MNITVNVNYEECAPLQQMKRRKNIAVKEQEKKELVLYAAGIAVSVIGIILSVILNSTVFYEDADTKGIFTILIFTFILLSFYCVRMIKNPDERRKYGIRQEGSF